MMTPVAPAGIPKSPLDRSFILILGILVAAIVFYGFSHTVDGALVHYRSPPPLILYVHALTASAWLILFVVQSWLVRGRDIRRHRQLGLWGLGLGTVVAVVGLGVVFVMREQAIARHPGQVRQIAFLSVPFMSFATFAVPFFLAAWWRKQPGLHRRLMVLATCSLTGAALARIPWLPDAAAPVVTLGLMIAAAVEDRLRTRRLDRVYGIGIPVYLASEALGVYLAMAAPPLWVAVAKAVLGVR
jgi:hypothetical protein